MNKLIIAFIFCAFTVQAQVENDTKSQETKTYYWFYLRLSNLQGNNSSMSKINLSDVGNEIISGSFDEFTKDHENGLKSGKVIVGPFLERQHAENSQSLYRSAGRGNGYSSGKDDDYSYTFFFVKPYAEDPTNGINFERIPSRVTTGSQNDFIALLNEGLSFEKLAIGPFYSYDLAERAKYVFRKNDGSGSLDKIDTLKIKSLKMMAKKWKSLKLDITKKSDDKTINKTMYRFSTNFPKSYFSGDATQIITVTANYTDSYHSSRSSFTLQGDEVTDNNHVIVSNTSTVYINILPFDIFSPSKIKGFLFESFIYNDCELIELEPVYITLIK